MPTCAYCRPLAYRAFAASLPGTDTPRGLFRAAWAIAQHELPEAALAEGEAAVKSLAATVKSGARSGMVDAVVAHLHDVIFEIAGFSGNREDYYNPTNSYLPEVLRTRRGLPITLVMVYRCVAAEVGITVHGVNAPGHFLAEVELGEGQRPMFVDPFYGGGALDQAEAYARIAQATGQAVNPGPGLLARATPRQWLARMLHNLQAALAAAGRDRDVFAMQELEQLLHVA